MPIRKKSGNLSYVPCIYIYTSIDFRSYGKLTWLIKWRAVSSNQRSCRYCYTDAPHGRWLNGWTKGLTAITQECCEQYWTCPGDSTAQNSSYTATYHPSRKLSKLDEPDAQHTPGELGRARDWCTPADPFKWMSKGRTSSSNLHTAALRWYEM